MHYFYMASEAELVLFPPSVTSQIYLCMTLPGYCFIDQGQIDLRSKNIFSWNQILFMVLFFHKLERDGFF